MLYKVWIDFVVYPSNANKVKSREDRLNTQNAVSETRKYENPELAKKNGFIVSWNNYEMLSKDDVFEAIWIDNDGNIIIWTEKRVWSLFRSLNGKEKMTFIPRNPDLSQLF